MKKSLSKSALMVALLTGNVIWGGTIAHAEEPSQMFTLDEMVVTANRYEKKAVDVAASVEVFDQERLQETGASNLYEALQFGTGLEIQQYGTSGASMGNMTSKIVIRGNGNGTLVLVNGVPLNIRGTYDLNDIPVENIERVEVVRGGGAVLYGSDATGGVINIITKKKKNNFVKAAVGNYGQQEYSGAVQADKLGFSYKYSKWGTVNGIATSRTDATDTKNWKGPENNNFELNYAFNDRLTLQASHNESIYDYISTKGKNAMGKWTPANDTRQNIKRNNIQLAYNDENGFKVTAYYLDRNREKEAWVLSNGSFYNSDDEKTYNYGLDTQKVWDVKDGKFLFGATYQNENYKSSEVSQKYSSSDTPDGSPEASSTGGNQNRNNYSVYTQYDRRLSAANSVVLSARESWTTGAPNGYNNTNFSGQAQFIHKLNEDSSIYASIGQSFKMPALYQIHKTQAGADLKPQTGLHYELGWKKNIADNKNLRVALFHYKIDDNITAEWVEKTNSFTYDNENLRNTGIEAEYTVTNPKGFGYTVAATYGNPQTEKIDADNYNFGYNEDGSRFQFKTGLTYKMDKWKAALNASYMSGRRNYKANSATSKKPASLEVADAKPYLLTNLNVEYQAQKDFSVFATFNNIFDRKDITYYSTSTDYYVTPFNFMLGCKYTF